MSDKKFSMDDYNDVAARLVEFREKHPDGSLQPADLGKPFEVKEIGGTLYIIVVAAAYRKPDDPRPGIGMAYEVFPGRTPYTKGSELQNAETSAWGRAIVAALAADTKRGIASAEEVRNRVAERGGDETMVAIAQFLDEARKATVLGDVSDLWKEAKAKEWLGVQVNGAAVHEVLAAEAERVKRLLAEKEAAS